MATHTATYAPRPVLSIPHTADCLRHVCSSRDGSEFATAMAEREARRILAETEPHRDGYSFADRTYRGPLFRALPQHAADCLVESLVAFIALDVE